MAHLNHLNHTDELIAFFASYLRDISTLITHLKSCAYDQVQFISPLPKSPTVIHNDIHSIMAACRRTYEDLKRVDSIFSGQLKARKNTLTQPSPSNSRVQEKLVGTISTQSSSRLKRQEQLRRQTQQKGIQKAVEQSQIHARHKQTSSRGEEVNRGRMFQRKKREQTIGEDVLRISKSSGSLGANLEPYKQLNHAKSSQKLQEVQKSNLECLYLIQKIRQEMASAHKQKK